MSITPTDTAAPAKDSAPNRTAAASDRSAREKEWKAEIHTPEAEYNANVPIDAIERDPANRVPSDEDIAARAESIKTVGLLQPVVLRDLGGGKYRLMAGETRWRACQLLKRPTIAARIYKEQTEEQASIKALVENAQRSDLTPIERAKRFKHLADQGVTQKEIGRLAGGLSQPVIANAIRLLELPAEIQGMVERRELSEAHAVVLVKWAKWPRVCACIARMVQDYGWSSKDLANSEFPFFGQCMQEGLIEEIRTKERYLSDGPIYKLPRHFHSHRDFIVGEYKTYYVIPEKEEDNVWAPERLKQDKEREAEEAARLAREAKAAAKNGGKSKEQIERAKAIAKNKALRAENTAGLNLALEKLKKTTSPTALLVAIIGEAALKGGFGSKRIQEAAAAVDVKLPKGAVHDGSYGLHGVDALRKMDATALARVVVAALLIREIDYANKNAWKLPENVEMVMNSSTKGSK